MPPPRPRGSRCAGRAQRRAKRFALGRLAFRRSSFGQSGRSWWTLDPDRAPETHRPHRTGDGRWRGGAPRSTRSPAVTMGRPDPERSSAERVTARTRTRSSRSRDSTEADRVRRVRSRRCGGSRSNGLVRDQNREPGANGNQNVRRAPKAGRGMTKTVPDRSRTEQTPTRRDRASISRPGRRRPPRPPVERTDEVRPFRHC
jgi:hypothetical protein